jgi:ribonuclease R
MSTKNDPGYLDPMAEREAAKYEHPVPSREAVLQLLAERGEPMSFEAIASGLAVTAERDLEAFGRRLRAMERDGQLLRNRRGLYGLVSRMDMVCGRVVGHPDGFGFLVPEEGGEDLFLSPREMRQLMHGDRAMARVSHVDARGRKEGTIVEVLERARKSVVGRFVHSDHMGFVVPDDKRLGQDVLIARGDESGAADGQIVVAEIVAPPTRRTGPVGRIIEVLGEHMAPGMEIEIAIRSHEIPHVWPDSVEREAARFAPEVPADAVAARIDLRDLPLVTIDGEDARDFDDAVYCERQGKGFRLLVAIADVSHYVRPGSALDAEAANRGNSVYFPRNVIPMLPEALSNGLCSINPHVDRLCMVCEANIAPNGEVKSFKFFEGVMNSKARLTYTKVAAMLVDRDAALRAEYAALVPRLEDLYDLYKVLHGARLKRGAVDFEIPETRIVFDEHRKIKKILPLERNDAHRLIEECMLAANVCAAEFLRKHKVPAPFRVHEGPTPDKLADLREFLFEFGLSLGGGDSPKAQHYAKLLDGVQGRPDSRLIQTVLLRSLSQAIYSPDNIGHFALGYAHYTHFTSPIRRYPDLIVHREIRKILRQEPTDLNFEQAKRVGERCSMTERRADEATREVIRWLKAEYMKDRIGEEFDGFVSGVTSFGMFVELTEVFVDGLVHITALGNDYFHFDAARHQLLGERTRVSFRLGDPQRVRVVRVDLDEAKIDFELAATPKRLAEKGGKRGVRSVRSSKGAGKRAGKGARRKRRR